MNILDIVKSMVEYSEKYENILPQIDRLFYILNYRTFGVVLPRRSGKTTFASEYARGRSSLLFHKHTPLKSFNAASELQKIRGVKSFGLKLQCIVLDEYLEFPEGFPELLVALLHANMLCDDFYIIMLGTPTR